MGEITSITSEPIPSWEDEQITVPGYVFTIATSPAGVALLDSYIGASIAVSGVCLTATKLDFENKLFEVGVSEETLRLTTFGSLVARLGIKLGKNALCNEPVNLERAAQIGGRNSGHSVQGHIDTVAKIASKTADGDSIVYEFEIDKSFSKYIVRKGFIAIDGVSLTVVDTFFNSDEENKIFNFTIMMVRHTQDCVIMSNKIVGDTVNVEVDVSAKYAGSVNVELERRVAELEKKVVKLMAKCGGTD